MTENYPWYTTVVDATLRQGDIFFDCSVLVPKGEFSEVEGNLKVKALAVDYDVIVMSQSCDLEQDNLELVLVCPHWPFSALAAKFDHFKSSKGKEALQRGHLPGYHLINRHEVAGPLPEPRVVDFRNVYGIPLDYLKNLCEGTGDRLRLLPPYREHLSQAFARFFMRVGLPVQVELGK